MDSQDKDEADPLPAEEKGPVDITANMSLYELVRTDFIRCECCSEVYTYPCILPCLHSFCGSCIDKLHDGDQEEVTVTCPTCHAIYSVPSGGFPCNHLLCNLVEIYDSQQEEEIPCTYCQYEFEENAATSRCIQCQDNLCQSCAAAHKKTKITRSHILAPFEQIRLGKYDADIRKVQKVNCNKHPMQACVKYCFDCKLLFCADCKEHKRHDVISIGSECVSELDLTKELTDTLSARLSVYSGRQRLLQGYTSRLEQNHDKVVKAVNERAELLHQLVDTQKNVLIEELCAHVSKAAECVTSELSAVEDLTNGYTSNIQLMQGLVHYSKPEELIDLQAAVARRLETVKHHSPPAESDDELSASYDPVMTSEECEEAINKLLGKLQIMVPSPPSQVQHQLNEGDNYSSHEPTPYIRPCYVPTLLEKVQLCVEFDSSLPTDSNNTWPTGVCTTVLGEIIICDRDNALIKIFSSTGVYKSSFPGEIEYQLIKPFDVASLSTGEVVVSDYGSESVKVFNTSGIGRLNISGEFEYPRGVATTKDDRILVLDSELGRVTIHSSSDGTLLSTVKGHSAATNMIDPYYVCVSHQSDIIVTDFAEPNLKLLSMAGGHCDREINYGEYGVSTRQGLLQPYGCCQDAYGITMIADNRNDKISVLLPSGVFAKHLITRKDGLWQPIALCVDLSGQLIVTEGLGKVKIFRYV